MRRLVHALGLAALVVAALVWAMPFLTNDREYAAVTPQPDPLFAQSDIALVGGESVCTDGAVLDQYSQVAHMRPSTPGAAAMPLELTLGSGASARIPATYSDHELVRVPVQAPTEATATMMCVRNLGPATVQLASSNDRTNARRPTVVGGEPVPENFVIVFSERDPRSIGERLPLSLERASAFRPVISPALLWPLLALFAIGVPLSVLGAYAWAVSHQGDGERA
jgi:hypothetical protein